MSNLRDIVPKSAMAIVAVALAIASYAFELPDAFAKRDDNHCGHGRHGGGDE